MTTAEHSQPPFAVQNSATTPRDLLRFGADGKPFVTLTGKKPS
jgi:hypothetical protein